MSAENTMPNKNFYYVRENRFCKNVKEKTETSFEKTIGEGDSKKIVHEERYNLITGSLRRIYVFEESNSDDTKSWQMLVIDLVDTDGKHECIQMYFESNAAVSFLKRLPNINLALPVSIKLSKDQKEGSEKAYDRIDCYQEINGESKICPYFWNKDNSLPRWNKITVGKGKAVKEVWDKTEHNEILERLVNFKNAEIVDTIKAVQKDGATLSDLEKAKVDNEFGRVLSWTKAPEQKTTGQVVGESVLNKQADDLPF